VASAGGGDLNPPPPPKSPIPPGTLPSAEPPDSDGSSHSLGAKASETIHVSLANGLVTLRRIVDGNGPVTRSTEDVCDPAYLAFLLGEAREGGGRKVDREPHLIVFDETIPDELARRTLDNLSLHETRAGEDRLTVCYRMSLEKMQLLREPIAQATLGNDIKAGTAAVGEIKGTKVNGSIIATDTNQVQRNIQFELFVADAKSAEIEKVQPSLKNALEQSTGRPLGQLAPDVHRALIKDLEGTKRRSLGTYNFADIGDVFITEIKIPKANPQLVTTTRR
jgi:hypothetical protein